MYAYGNSALQAALLRLFVRCDAVLPGLWVGTLTRESVIGERNLRSRFYMASTCQQLSLGLAGAAKTIHQQGSAQAVCLHDEVTPFDSRCSPAPDVCAGA